MNGCASERSGLRPPLPRARRLACALTVAWCGLPMTLIADEPARTRPDSLRFEVRLTAGAGRRSRPSGLARGGRLMVVLAPPGTREPRLTLGETGMDAPPVLGRDVDGLEPGRRRRSSTAARPSSRSTGSTSSGPGLTPSRPCCTATST